VPWEAVADHPDHDGPAVVDTDTGQIVSTHGTMDQAHAHVAALFSATGGEYRDLNYFDSLGDVPNFRSIPMADIEMPQVGNEFKFDGIAAPVDTIADYDIFTEEYRRGSFRKYLAGVGKDHNIPFCHEHDPQNRLMGTTKSGRVQLEEDTKGLRTRARVVKTELSERVKALVDSGDVGGMSIGMVVGRNHQIELRAGRPHRSILGFKRLLDVCTTFEPSYPTTEAQFRSATIQLATTSPDVLQQVLLGAYPQQQDGADDSEPVGGDVVDDSAASGAGADDGATGVVEHRSIAARKRALQLFIHETGGDEVVH